MSALLVSLFAARLLFAPPDAVDPPSPAPARPEITEVAEPQAEAPIEVGPSFEFQTFESDPIAVKQFVLDNGLTVLLSENHERPRVFGAVVVRTGGKNDPADNTGMAHYLEHMLFKGTEQLGTSNWEAEAPLQAEIVELYERHKRADSAAERAELQAEIAAVVERTYAYAIPNELDHMLGEIGGVGVNAFTSEDETVYHNSFPASQIEPWLEIYAHRFVDPVFRLFPTELEAVYEEKNIWLDRFETAAYEQFLAHAFPEHPYGTQSVLGEIEHLKAPSLVAVQEYFDEYYVANNMALVLAGDFDAEAIMPIIAEHFGAWKRGPDPEPRTGKVEPFVGRELVRLRVTPIRVGAYAFRTPTARDPDFAALQVMRELLSNDQGSGYIDTLVNDGKILIAAPFPLSFADHGLDVLFFAPRFLGQTFKNAEKQILEQYQRIGRGDFDEQQMLAFRDALRRAEDRQWENNEERALAIADSFIRRDGWQDYLEYRKQLAAVTKQDVMRVAATYFGDDHLGMRSRMGFPKKPQLSKPNYPTVTPQPGVHSRFYEQVMSRPSAEPKLRFVDFEADVTTTAITDNVVLHTNENPFNDTYSLGLVFGVGHMQIRELVVAGPYLERIGTTSHSPTALREQLSLLGTTLTIGVEGYRTYVYLEGPEQHLPAALELIEGLLRNPVGDQKRLKALRREQAGYQKVMRQDPEYLGEALMEYAMYGDASTYLRDYGRAGMRELDSDELLAAWQRVQGYGLEIRYSGQREPAQLVELLGQAVPLTVPRKPAVVHGVRKRVLPDRDTVYFLPQRKQIQTQLIFLVDGDPVPADQHAVADAFDEYIGGGMGGLVFQEIREYRALAYAASGRFARDDDPQQAGYFVGGVGCQVDKTFEAIDVMLGLIHEMPAKPERMEPLRAALIRGLEVRSPSFRYVQATIDWWRRRGYVEDPRRARLAEYARLGFEDIRAFHEAQVAGRAVVLVVVGDPRGIDRRRLEGYGELIEVGEREIFAR